MTTLATTFGIILIAIGVVAYVAVGATSVTALIPAFLGALLAVCGLVGRREALRRHAMHAAAVLALLGLLGTFQGVLSLPALFAGTAARPAAVVAQSLTAVLCLVFLVLAVRSFISARRQRSPSSTV